MSSVERRPKMLFGAAAALYVFSLVEVSPAFLAPSAAGAELTRAPSLRGGASSVNFETGTATPVFYRSACQAASTFLALSACALAARTRSSDLSKNQRSSRSSRTQLCVSVQESIKATLNSMDDGEEERKLSPVNVYANALAQAALKKEEIRAVTKDVMKAKDLSKSDEWKDKLTLFINEPYMTEPEKASGICDLWEPLDSTVFRKFAVFLAKKNRLAMLYKVMDQYMLDQYDEQSIAPVRVKSAKRLSEEQKEKIIAKMKKKIGASDIKLICEVQSDLVGGLTMEWAFTDPDTMKSPTEGVDLSVKSIVKRCATKEGVPVNVP